MGRAVRHFTVLMVASALAACVEGPPGPPGPSGPAGAQGATGLTGASGVQGIPGQSVTVALLAEGDPLCPYGGTRFILEGATVGVACNGVPGAVGPQGPQGIIAAVSSSGPSGVSAFATLAKPLWVSPTVQVTVTPEQKVLVNATATLGSTAAGGAAGLRLYVCHKKNSPTVSAPCTTGLGAWDLQLAQNTRHTFSLSNVLTSLETGTYDVGLCGYVDSRAALPASNWNSNEQGYVTALVMN